MFKPMRAIERGQLATGINVLHGGIRRFGIGAEKGHAVNGACVAGRGLAV